MSALKDLARDNWLWLTVLAGVAILASLFFRSMARMNLDRLAKLSICTNLVYVLLSLLFQKQLLPSGTLAFPQLAQVFIWVQFAMAGMIFVRPIDRLCAPKPGGETDVDNISVVKTSTSEDRPLTGWKSISQSEWLWIASADGCYIATFAILMELRHLTFHP
jgi:hypothetical protein